MRKFLTYGTFPAVFGGGLCAGVWACSQEIHHGLIVLCVSLSGALMIAILERVHPYQKDWNQSRGDITPDALHLVFSMTLVPEVLKALTFVWLYAAGAWLSDRIGLGLWPHHWHWAGQLVVAMVVSEFGAYWFHRLMHEHEILWRVHATHHSAPRLYWLNAARFHPLDIALTYLGHVVPLALLGCPADVLVLFTIFTSLHGMFQHANVHMRLGPLNWVFSMAELHRWHHSKTIDEGNNNYGANLIFWDIVFGTRFLPKDREPPAEIGIMDLPNFPTKYTEHLLSPFRWEQVKTSAGPKSTE